MTSSISGALQRVSKLTNVLEEIHPTGIIGNIVHYMKQSYEWLVLTPLARLYMFGPSVGGIGFWGGQDISEICAQKTNLSSEFWKENSFECFQLISKNFYGMVVLCESIFYFLLLWKLATCLSYFLCMYCCKKKENKNPPTD
jgi:hypothetical protein